MITVTELAALIGLSKERTKQLVNEAIKENPTLDISTGSIWYIGPSAVTKFLKDRGRSFPDHKVVTFAALKGGIGKTTISTNVAVRAAALGAKVLLIDLDPEACATNGLIKPDMDISKATIFYDLLKEKQNLQLSIIQSNYPGLDLVPSALRNHHLEKLVGNLNPKRIIKDRIDSLHYNLIILELPPSFTTLTGSAYLAADLIVLPCTPSIYSLESVALTIEAIDALAVEFECSERNYKVLMNQYNSSRVASQEIIKTLLDTYKSKVFPFYIRESADVANATNAGSSIFDVKCAKNIRESFHELTMQICGVQQEEKQ
jgi:chromosome partitioning protein